MEITDVSGAENVDVTYRNVNGHLFDPGKNAKNILLGNMIILGLLQLLGSFCKLSLKIFGNHFGKVTIFGVGCPGFFSKLLMGGTQNFRSPSVPNGDKVIWGGGDLQKKSD